MTATTHRIRRQAWVVRAPSEEQALAVRRLLRDNLETVLLPAFGNAFDRAVEPERVIHIKRLELHARIRSVQDTIDQLPELLRRSTADQLRAAIPVQAVAPDREVGRTPTISPEPESALGRYLESGSVPWWSMRSERSETLDELRRDFATHRAAVIRDLRAPMPVSERIARLLRLLQLVRASEWDSVAESIGSDLLPALRTALLSAIATLAAESGGSVTPHVAVYLAAAALAAAAVRAEIMELQELFDLVTARNPAVEIRARQAVIRFVQMRIETTAAAVSEPGGPPGPALPQSSPPIGADEAFPVAFARAPVAERPAPSSVPFSMSVAHAGLILLHPFLTHFFEKLEIDPASESDREHAGALLCLLASGREDAYEFELSFIKVLLGTEMSAPLTIARGLILDRDRQETDALLQAVIQHWTALKNTSVDGLRTGFLQRAGLLREEEDGWRLHVQREPFDVLLEQLPWAIGTVVLPWLRKPIFTQW